MAHFDPDPGSGHCQSKSNQSHRSRKLGNSGRKLAPLGQSGRAALLEYVATVEVTVLAEMIVNGGVSGSKFLLGLDIPEPSHCALSSSEQREAELDQIKIKLTAPPPDPVRIHLNIASYYVDKVSGLRECVTQADTREEAAGIIRRLVDEVRL